MANQTKEGCLKLKSLAQDMLSGFTENVMAPNPSKFKI